MQVEDWELERLLSGRWLGMTRTQQLRMAYELREYRRATRELLQVERKATLGELTALGQEMGDYGHDHA